VLLARDQDVDPGSARNRTAFRAGSHAAFRRAAFCRAAFCRAAFCCAARDR